MKRTGTPITEKAFWAYAVANGKAILVRCKTLEDAKEEKERLKHSDARMVGHTSRAIPEMDMWMKVKANGWKLALVR